MPENIYTRQREFLTALPQRVDIVGAGGVGSWTAIFLAMAGVPALRIFDPDTVNLTNLNRLPFSPERQGYLKVNALKASIQSLRPTCKIDAMTCLWAPDFADLLADSEQTYPDVIIATTDSAGTRRRVFDWCRSLRRSNLQAPRYIDAGAEGESATCSTSPADFEDPRTGYETVPVWVGSAVSAAIMAAYRAVHHHGHLHLSSDSETSMLTWIQAVQAVGGAQ